MNETVQAQIDDIKCLTYGIFCAHTANMNKSSEIAGSSGREGCAVVKWLVLSVLGMASRFYGAELKLLDLGE